MKRIRSSTQKMLERIPSATSLVLFLLLVIEVIAGPPLAHAESERQSTIPGIPSYHLGSSELMGVSICIPQSKIDTIRVGIYSHTISKLPNGTNNHDYDYIGGGKVKGIVKDETIAGIRQGQGVEVQVNRRPPLVAYFDIKAKKIGKTEITFIATETGDEWRYPGKTLVADSITIPVEVSPCYEAVVGALGTVWPKSDVCSLARPFVLEGKNPDLGYGVSTGTNAMFFWPSPADFHTGWYVYVNTQNYPANFTCVEVGKGKYDVIFHQTSKILNPDDPVVDLEMQGSSVMFCPDPFYTPSIGYLIALKAINPPNLCKESLP